VQTGAGRGRELILFGAAYLACDLARRVFVGDFADARLHADWIVELEQRAGLAVEGPVQRALDGGVACWLMSNVYLAARSEYDPHGRRARRAAGRDSRPPSAKSAARVATQSK
jgi:hypothetical protein